MTVLSLCISRTWQIRVYACLIIITTEIVKTAASKLHAAENTWHQVSCCATYLPAVQ